MKKTILIVVNFLFLSGTLLTQENEKPIVIHPLIGEQLDRIEQDYFKLFPTIDGFQEAEFYINPDSSLKVFINYELDGITRDTLIENYFTLSQINNYIVQRLTTEINTTQGIDRGKYISALTNSNTITNGELLSIRISSFLLLNMDEEIYYTNTNSTFDVSHHQFNEISKVTAVDKTNIAKYLYPVVAGLSAVLIYSTTVSDTKTSGTSISEGISEGLGKGIGKALVGGLIGGMAAILGYFMADAIPIWSVSETEYTAPFNEDDIIGLSKLARFKVSEPFYLEKIK